MYVDGNKPIRENLYPDDFLQRQITILQPNVIQPNQLLQQKVIWFDHFLSRFAFAWQALPAFDGVVLNNCLFTFKCENSMYSDYSICVLIGRCMIMFI